MTPDQTALKLARRTAAGSSLNFDGILVDAFVMRSAVGFVHDADGVRSGSWLHTEQVVHVGSTLNYDFVETADEKRYLILSHENDAAKASLAHVRRHIELNPDYYGPKRWSIRH